MTSGSFFDITARIWAARAEPRIFPRGLRRVLAWRTFLRSSAWPQVRLDQPSRTWSHPVKPLFRDGCGVFWLKVPGSESSVRSPGFNRPDSERVFALRITGNTNHP